MRAPRQRTVPTTGPICTPNPTPAVGSSHTAWSRDEQQHPIYRSNLIFTVQYWLRWLRRNQRGEIQMCTITGNGNRLLISKGKLRVKGHAVLQYSCTVPKTWRPISMLTSKSSSKWLWSAIWLWGKPCWLEEKIGKILTQTMSWVLAVRKRWRYVFQLRYLLTKPHKQASTLKVLWSMT